MNLYEQLSEAFHGFLLPQSPIYEVIDEADLDDAFFKMLFGMSNASLRALRKYTETPDFRSAVDSIVAQMDSEANNKRSISTALRNL